MYKRASVPHQVVGGVRFEEAKEHEGHEEAQRAGHQTQEPLPRRRETVARIHAAASPTGGHDDEARGDRHEEQEEGEAIPLGPERDQHHTDDVQQEVELAMASKAQHSQIHFGYHQDGGPDGQEAQEEISELEHVIGQQANGELRFHVAPVIELRV